MAARCADAIDEVLTAAVAQVIAVHAGDDHILKLERGNRFAQVLGLTGVQRVGPAVAHVAKRAATGALVAHDHEGGCSVAEALTDVWARGFLADRHKIVFAQDALDFIEARGRTARFDADPIGLSQHLVRLDLDGNATELGGGLLLGLGVVGFDGLRFAHHGCGHEYSFFCYKRESRWSASVSAASCHVTVTPIVERSTVRRPAYPQGLMRSKGSRSMATFSARPW